MARRRGGGETEAAAARMAEAMNGFTEALDNLTTELNNAAQRLSQVNVSGGGADAGAGLGGAARGGEGRGSQLADSSTAPSALGRLAGRAGTAAVGAALAANVQAASSGFVSAAQGGTFAGGARQAFNDIAAAVPVLGEIGGFAPAQRARETALANLNAATGTVDALAGPEAINPRVRQLLAETNARRANNLERGQQLNRAALQTPEAQQALAAGLGAGAQGLAALASESTINLMLGQFGMARAFFS